MKKYLTTISLIIAIVGMVASVILNDKLFAISFLWVLIENIKNFPSHPDDEEE